MNYNYFPFSHKITNLCLKLTPNEINICIHLFKIIVYYIEVININDFLNNIIIDSSILKITKSMFMVPDLYENKGYHILFFSKLKEEEILKIFNNKVFW